MPCKVVKKTCKYNNGLCYYDFTSGGITLFMKLCF